MKIEIDKTSLGDVLTAEMKEGEVLYTEAGAFISSVGEVEIEAYAGDLVSGILRTFGGNESLFLNKIMAKGDAEVVVGPAYPAEITKIKLNSEEFLLGDGVYVAHVGDVEVSAKLGGLTSLLAGSGLMFSKVSGTGDVFVAGYGGVRKVELKETEVMVLDNTNFVAVNAEANIEKIKIGKTLLSSILTTEGFGFKIHGPATVYYQTGSLPGIAGIIKRFLGIK